MANMPWYIVCRKFERGVIEFRFMVVNAAAPQFFEWDVVSGPHASELDAEGVLDRTSLFTKEACDGASP